MLAYYASLFTIMAYSIHLFEFYYSANIHLFEIFCKCNVENLLVVL